MINPFNIEQQAAKRVHKFILHTATEENLEAEKTRLIIIGSDSEPGVHLYQENTFIKTISLKSVVEFFGTEYEASQQQALIGFLKKLSGENNIALSETFVVICEAKGQLGAHLYKTSKYLRPVPIVKFLAAFY